MSNESTTITPKEKLVYIMVEMFSMVETLKIPEGKYLEIAEMSKSINLDIDRLDAMRRKLITNTYYQQSIKPHSTSRQHILTKGLQSAEADRQRGEICMFYHRERNIMGFNTKELVTADMVNWRKLRKQGKFQMLEGDNRDCEINGRKYYTLVPHTPNESMGLDNVCFMLDGYIFYFRKKVNRDMVFKYVMGIK
jgi:hypothetical protein